MILRSFVLRRSFSGQRPLARFLQPGTSSRELLRYFEAEYQPLKHNFLRYAGVRHEASDLAQLLMRMYASENSVNHCRLLLFVSLRDIPVEDLRSSLFTTLFQILVEQPSASKRELNFLWKLVGSLGLVRTAEMYQSLIEYQLRSYQDVADLWFEFRKVHLMSSGVHEEANKRTNNPVLRDPIPPSCWRLIRLLARGVAPTHSDTRFVAQVGQALIALPMLGDLSEDISTMSGLLAAMTHSCQHHPRRLFHILLSIEKRCLAARVSMKRVVERRLLVELLRQCALTGDVPLAEKFASALDRQGISWSHDIFALMIVVLSKNTSNKIIAGTSRASCAHRALDLLCEMAQRGMLSDNDAARRRCVLESLGVTLEPHYLVTLAEAFTNGREIDIAYEHLEKRHHRRINPTREGALHNGNESNHVSPVPCAALDVLVMASVRLGDEARAIETIESFALFDLVPSIHAYHSLLLGVRSYRRQRAVLQSMADNNVSPTSSTFRLLIRRSVTLGDLPGALRMLDLLVLFPNCQLQTAHLTPILEAASGVGDVLTCLRLVQRAVGADVSIPKAVLEAVLTTLESHGADTSGLKSLLPEHDKIRARESAERADQVPN